VRPSVSEQLEGIRHILAKTIAPEVTDPYSAGILEGLIASLDSLANGWKHVPEFLRWDAHETARILGVATPHLDEASAGGLRAAMAEAPPNDDLDVGALEVHHRHIREVLEQAVPAIVARPELRSLLVTHLKTRSQRFPVPTFPVVRSAMNGGSGAHSA
jgi:hypothetical protein